VNAALGVLLSSTIAGKFFRQCLQTIAAAWISSAQNGHVLTVEGGAGNVGVTIADETDTGAIFRPGTRSLPHCGQMVAASGIPWWQK
jgi:nitrate/nitrite transporter NarK